MIDFPTIAAHALSAADRLLPTWLPGGSKIGRHWVCGNLQGEPGTSLKVAMDVGCWTDYADPNSKGGDLISLYAAMRGISQSDAAHIIAQDLNVDQSKPVPVRQASAPSTICKPPADAPPPSISNATAVYRYADINDETIHFVARFDTPEGKTLRPYCWDSATSSWAPKGWPGLRPLYGLPELAKRPKQTVLIVEGEKCADALRRLDVPYTVITWSGGSKAVQKTDWNPLCGRNILIWPDADEPGTTAAREITGILSSLCPEIKLLDVSGQPEGWDCADAIETMTWAEIIAWAKPRVSVVHPVAAPAPATDPTAAHIPPPNVDGAAGFSTWMALGLKINPKGNVTVCLSNAVRILERWEPLRGKCWYDDFHCRFLTSSGPGEPAREWSDTDDLELTVYIQQKLDLAGFDDGLIHKALRTVAMRTRRNEPLDWVKSLTWDGTPRIAHFMEDCLGAAPSDYMTAASSNFWLSLVARIARPGCKADNMIILEGAQGKLKSTALAEIAGPCWHTEATESIHSKDFYLAFQGKLIVEIAELDSFSKGDITKVKQVITNRCDRYRSPYGRASEDHPRRCVFAGTTNETEYLKDSTGARRFWPIETVHIDIPMIRLRREQCFAEAYHQLQAGAMWWEMPVDSTAEQQESRREYDGWEQLISNWLYQRGEVHMSGVLEGCLNIPPAQQGRAEQMRAGKCMKRIGWSSIVSKTTIGKSQRIWRKEKPPAG